MTNLAKPNSLNNSVATINHQKPSGKMIIDIGAYLSIILGVLAILAGFVFYMATRTYSNFAALGRDAVHTDRFTLYFFDGLQIVQSVMYNIFDLAYGFRDRPSPQTEINNMQFWGRLLGVTVMVGGLGSIWSGFRSLRQSGLIRGTEILRDKLIRDLMIGLVGLFFVFVFFSFNALLFIVLIPLIVGVVGAQISVNHAANLRIAHTSTTYWKSYMVRHGALYAMLALPIAFFIIFRYWPMLNLLLSFTLNNIFLDIMQVPFAANHGTANFTQAFGDPFFRYAVRNTLVFSALDIAIGFPAPIILALLLNELKFKKFKRITQTISYMPHFLSWIIISGLAIQLLSPTVGTINNILTQQGLDPVPFLNSNMHWVGTVVTIGVWRSLGFNTILYLAAITSVNPELYEAADVDGATRLRKMWHVTLPGIRPVIVILLILAMGQIMGADFERFMALGNPLVSNWYSVLPVFIFRRGLESGQYALTAAVGLIASLINLTLLFCANFVAKRLGGEGLW